MAESFGVPGEYWRESASSSLPLAGPRSATTQEQVPSLPLAARLVQRPSTNMIDFVAV
ncbi:hypothetical protein A2U01_0062909 [Trifolium medium]|uniref:Uncharacterized protein n=2 Tax=Trifolium medium TaxID=97028 RepID=A0A392S1C5_9FABA|nr:hypothetical protein [Trifolium medium]